MIKYLKGFKCAEYITTDIFCFQEMEVFTESLCLDTILITKDI